MEVPSHRACAHCRSQKVRCLPDDANPDVCQRCTRAGRPCVFTPLQKRKQRKRTDTRVAELEKEMRAMRALLKEKNEGPIPEERSGSDAEASNAQERGTEPSGESESSFGKLATSSMYGELLAAGRHIASQQSRQDVQGNQGAQAATGAAGKKGDVVDRGIVTMPVARRLVEHYNVNLYPQCPKVYLSCTADELRETKPTLFLAVIAAAAEIESADLATALDLEILQEYANRTVMQSEKSLELVQSLLVSAIWYVPPNKFGQLKYYEYIHMAATMAAEIGITTRPSKLNRSRFAARNGSPASSVHPSEDARNPDLSMSIRHSQESEGTGNIECRRSFLACYAICVGVAASLRRPTMMRVTSYTRECLEYLENSPHAAPGDRQLAAWVRLWMIGEEISAALSYDDPGDTASLLDTTTQLMVTAFDKRLTDWRSRFADEELTPTLSIIYFTLRMYLHELVLHIDHSPEDFKAPYQMGVIHRWNEKEVPIKPAVESIANLVSSSHRLIDSFVEMGSEAAQFLPVFVYVRVSFAAFVLAKLCLSSHSKHGRLANLIDRGILKSEPYVDKLILFVQSVVGPQGRQVPSMFLALLFKVRQWCAHPELIQQAEDDGTPSDIWPEGPENARRRIALEGPRITEAMSNSSETSPETTSGSGGTPAMWNTPAAWNGEIPATYQHSAREGTGKQKMTAQSSQGQSINIPNTPQSCEPWAASLEGYEQMFSQPDHNPGMTAATTAATAPSSKAAAPIVGWPTADQMELDENMLTFLNNMDDFTQGDMTGLEDWETFPTDLDFDPTQEQSSWQTPQQQPPFT